MKSLFLFVIFLALSSSFQANADDTLFFPMAPVYQKSGFKKKFIGVELSNLNHNQFPEAMRQCERLSLYPFKIRFDRSSSLYCFVRPMSVTWSRSTTIGLSFEFGGGGADDSVILGEDITYGFKMSSLGAADLRSKKGLWLTDPLSSIVNQSKLMMNADSAMELAQISAGLQFLQSKRPSGIAWPSDRFSELNYVKRMDLNSSSLFMATVPTSKNKELLKATHNFKNQNKEFISWQQSIQGYHDRAPVWQDKDSDQLVSDICAGIEMRMGLSQRAALTCSVFANLTPYAFAYPSGDLFVTAGLFGVIPNVDTLIFFLAHESSHVFLQHTTQRLKQKDLQENFLSTLSILSNVFVLSNARSLTELGGSLAEQKISLDSMKVGTQAMLTMHQRDDEDEADELGMQIALELGADPKLIVEGLKQLEAYLSQTFSANQQSLVEKALHSDHRDLSQRAAALKQNDLQAEELASIRQNFSSQFEKIHGRAKGYSRYFQLGMRSQ